VKVPTIKYAVNTFNEMRGELGGLIEEIGLPALVCMVRQHHMDVDRGWAFFEIGVDVLEEPGLDGVGQYVFWGKLIEDRADKEKTVMVIIDPETIDSIEFEVFDPRLDDSADEG
jgi:hypothetical protein